MTGVRYCEPCRRLLCGKAQPRDSGKYFVHHSDAKSFSDSLQLPCGICSMAWGSRIHAQAVSKETCGIFYSNVDFGESDEKHLRFFQGDLVSKDIVFIPWENMRDYQFPYFLSHRTDSLSALDFVLHRYRECNETHIECKRPLPSVSFRPSRLIDVGKSENSHVRICDTQGFSKDEPYVCLSYCWGQTQPLKLTRETEQRLRDGYPVSALVKTFQNAITITRKLGFRYLWIDSLCIFQDNKAEWSIEARCMGSVYNQAACTIAATSAKDSEGGLFFDRNPEVLRPRRLEVTWADDPDIEKMKTVNYPSAGYYWCDVMTIWPDAIEDAPLNSRAWVSQERNSSRRIIHFTDTQLFWECHEYMACENYQKGLPEWALPFWSNDPTILKRSLHQLEAAKTSLSSLTSKCDNQNPFSDVDLVSKQDLYYSWGQFRIHYSKCEMTEETDKLVAIQGIASGVGRVLGDHLVAGLWHNRLLEELCWYKANEKLVLHEPTKWRAPTWSWASSNAAIWISNTTKFHYGCTGRQFWGDLIDLDVKTRLSGELEHGTMRIRCKMIRASITLDASNRPYYSYHGTLRFTDSAVEIQAENLGVPKLNLRLDHPGYSGSHDVYMAIVQRCSHEVDPSEDEDSNLYDAAEGLLMIPKCGCDNVFKRVGLFWVTGVVSVKSCWENMRQQEVL